MATIRERQKADGTAVFHAQVRLAGFPARTASFRSRATAKKWATTVEAEMIEGKHFRSVEARKRSVADAIDRYLKDELPKKRDPLVGKQARDDGRERLVRFSLPPGYWVHEFVGAVKQALDLPAFCSWTAKKRRERATRIRPLMRELTSEIENAGLYGARLATASFRAGLIAHSDDSGFEWDESHLVQEDGQKRYVVVGVSEVLEQIVAAACEEIQAPVRGKGGENARAIRFVREMATYTKDRYGTPLHDVLAVLCNALFNTDYGEKRIGALVGR